MRFDIRYRTRFAYDPGVSESHNELRACPVTDEFQRLVTYRVGAIPQVRPLSFTDYWGTRVDAFGVRLPHRHLEVVAEATVETSPRDAHSTPTPCSTSSTNPEFQARHHECLQATRHTDWDDELLKLATECVDERAPMCWRRRSESTIWSARVAQVREGRHRHRHARHRSPRTAAPAYARTSRTLRSRCAAPSASRRGTCRATCSPPTTRPPNAPTSRWCTCRRTRGSKSRYRGRAGSRSTRRTDARSASST